MKKSVAKDASTSERKITRSMTKSDVVLDRNNQVFSKSGLFSLGLADSQSSLKIFAKMKKSVAKDASTSESKITRSMTKSDVVLDRNNQVVRKKIKSGKEVWMPFLSEEIIFKILLFLPAKVLCDVMKLVCKLWCKVIRDPIFIKEHFSQSPNNSPFLVVSYDDYFELHFVNEDETAWNFIRKIDQRYLTHGSGLILTADLDDPTILYLLNPSTNQIVQLPKIRIKYYKRQAVWLVAYSPSTSKYKVSCANVSYRKAYLLTVGVDNKWREIVLAPYTRDTTPEDSFFSMHEAWGYYYLYEGRPKWHLVLDLETNVFYNVDFFNLEVEGRILYDSGVSSDRIVSVAVEENRKCWHFWELVDYKNGGEWRKLGSFDSKSKRSEIKKIMGIAIEKGIRPEVVTKGGDEVILKSNLYNSFFSYNFKTGTVSDSVPNPPVLTEIGKSTLVFSNSLVKAPGRSIKSVRHMLN